MRLSILLLSSVLPFSLFAQLSGQVRDHDGGELAYVNLLLLQPSDSSLITGTQSDSDGSFRLQPPQAGEYLLAIRAIGYNDQFLGPLMWEAGLLELEMIELQAAAHYLNRVEVRAERLQIEQSAEGQSINVQESIMTAGSSALQVLERSPGVYVDRRNGSISLNGQSGVGLMIDGQLVRVPLATALAMLEGRSGDQIARIELLTNPAASRDAEGTAGIINIVFAGEPENGSQASVGLNLGHGYGPKAGANLQWSSNTAKTLWQASYAYMRDETFYRWRGLGQTQLSPIFGESTQSDFSARSAHQLENHNLSLGVEQQLSSQTTLGAQWQWQRNRDLTQQRNTVDYLTESTEFQSLAVELARDSRWRNWQANVFLEQQLKENQRLRLDVDYLRFRNDQPSDNSTTFSDEAGTPLPAEEVDFASEQFGRSSTDIDIGVAQLDYQTSWPSGGRLETGLKASVASSANQGSLSFWEAGEWQEDLRYRTELKVDETILAAYASLDLQIKANTQVRLGGRWEYWERIFSAQSGTPNRYFNRFFPNLSISRQLGEGQQLRLSYSERISRPEYNELASYFNYNDPVSAFSGNPLLRFTLSKQLRLAYQGSLGNVAIVLQRELYPIARFQLSAPPSNDLILVSPQNVAYENSLRLETNTTKELRPWWNFQLGATFALRRFSLVHTPQAVKHTYATLYLHGNQSFQLPKKFSLELSGWLNTPFFEGSRRLAGFGMLNFGLRKDLGRGGSLQLSVSDLLQSMKIYNNFGALTPEVFGIESEVWFRAETADHLVFRLSYRYHFSRGAEGRSSRLRAAAEAARVTN